MCVYKKTEKMQEQNLVIVLDIASVPNFAAEFIAGVCGLSTERGCFYCVFTLFRIELEKGVQHIQPITSKSASQTSVFIGFLLATRIKILL